MTKRRKRRPDKKSRASGGAPIERAPSELDGALEELAAEGEKDSEGSFTIAADLAAKKLSSFQLPTPQSWILVLVQAANRAKAKQVKVRQSRSQTSVEISGVPRWEWKELVPYLAEFNDDGSFLASLAVAFRALGARKDGHDFEVLTSAGSTVRRTQDDWVERDPVLGHWRGFQMRVTFDHLDAENKQLGFWERRRAASQVQSKLLFALQEEAMASPVPVIVDGRKVTNVLRQGEKKTNRLVFNNSVWEEKRPLALFPVPGDKVPGVAFPLARKQMIIDAKSIHTIDEARRVPSPGPEGWSALAVLWLCIKHHAWSGVRESGHTQRTVEQPWVARWIKDGVVVSSEDLGLRSCLAMDLFLCADGLPTDLSGLQLRTSPERSSRRKKLGEAIYQQFAALAKQSKDGVEVASAWSPWLTAFAAGGVFVGSAVTVGGGAAVAATLLSGAGMSLVSNIHHLNSDNREIAEAANRELRQLPKRARAALS